MAKNAFTLQYAPSTIEQLGIGLYNNLPAALIELITNSYDADATKVDINISYKDKLITVSDNGYGMSKEEINNSFLTVSRNRRLSGTDITPKGRPVTGRKGLGKLALFGIASIIRVKTIKNNICNKFEMDYNDITKTTDPNYHPTTIYDNKYTENASGTTISVSHLKQKRIMAIDDLAASIAKRFERFSNDFLLTISNEEGENIVLGKNAFRKFIKPLKNEFTFEFPNNFINDKNRYPLLFKYAVTGTVFLSEKPLSAAKQGYYVMARGKLASERSPEQFGNQANDYFATYAVGFFNIDYIDNQNEDLITTDRKSVRWGDDETLEHIRDELKSLIISIQSKWRKKRQEKKAKKIKKEKENNEQVKDILDSSLTSSHEKKLIDKFYNQMTDSKENISSNQINQIFNKYVAPMTTAEKYKTSPYNSLIPEDFVIPKAVHTKLQYLLEEAKLILTLNSNKNQNIGILSEGLLLRALIDSSTTAVIEDNEQEIRSMPLLENVDKDKDLNLVVTLENCKKRNKLQRLSYSTKFKILVKFLIFKSDVKSSRFENLTNRIDIYTEDFNTLMHDSQNMGVTFQKLQEIWNYVSPQLSLSYKYLK